MTESKNKRKPTGASTNPKNLGLNKNLNLIKIENFKLKFEIEV